MFRIRFLRNIFLLTLAVAVVLPLCGYYLIHPAYERTVTEETEKQAVHFVGYLMRSLGLDSRALTRSALPQETSEGLQLLRSDQGLVKLRIFSAQGEVIYSTVHAEVGRINNKPYFREHVRSGRIYSKVVRHDGVSAEHQPVRGDVVETYVPVMVEGDFGGAVETYYDISSLEKIEAIARRSSLLMWGISLSLLLAMVVVLRRTRTSVERQLQAEHSLREANLCLEERVVERTAQLEEVNRWLKAEMTEHRLVREKVDNILWAVADGLLVVDGDGRLALMNEAAGKLLRLDPHRTIGQSLNGLQDGAPLVEQLRTALQGEPESSELEIDTNDPDDGTDRHIRLRISKAAASRGGDGGEQRVLLLQDVTKERRIDLMKREFLAMVAHELHTPLTAVIGYTELLVEQTDAALSDTQKREFAAHVHNMALNLARIVDDLLDIGRIEAGHRLSLYMSDFSPCELIRQIVRKYEGANPGHRFVLAIPDDPIVLHGDCSRLEQVLENLLNNAVKYSPNGGVIRIAVECNDGECHVSISDQGIGMSREQEERVFDKFYRADRASAAAQGSGLGMSIAKHLIESHGGEIWLNSQLGRGTNVCFSLPLQRREGPDSEA